MKNPLSFFFYLILGCILSIPSYAQKLPPEKLHFYHLPTDALTDDAIYGLLQDKQGFIWFCTEDALVRYDGINFLTYKYDPNDSTSRPPGRGTCLFEDKENVLWMGTYQGGLISFNKVTGKFIAYKNDPDNSASINDNTVYNVTEDEAGILWIGTRMGGVNSFDRKTKKFTAWKHNVNDSTSICEGEVYKVVNASKEKLWLGTRNGLVSFEKATGKCIIYTHHEEDPYSVCESKVNTMCLDENGILWLLTSQGFDEFNPATQKFIHHIKDLKRDSLNFNHLREIIEDHNGLLWITTNGAGIYAFNKKTNAITNYRNDTKDPNSLGDNDVLTIMEDASGLLWLGKQVHGVDFTTTRSDRFSLYQYDPSGFKQPNDNIIFFVYEDKDNVIWIGSYRNGLYMLDKKKGYFSRVKDNPLSEISPTEMQEVSCIYEDSQGILWIGTNGNGLIAYDKKARKSKRYLPVQSDPHSISSERPICILEDDQHLLWIGTYGGGLNSFDRKTESFTNYVNDTADIHSLSKDNVFCMAADTGGILWIGTGGGGLNMFDSKTGKFTVYKFDAKNANSLSRNIIYCLRKTKDGLLWIGTAGGGLNSFNPKTKEFERYTEKDGLINNTVVGILPDSKGNLWCSTYKGISELVPSSGSESNSKLSFKFRNFDKNDGLNDGFQTGPYFLGKDGYMYFGGMTGVNAFYPDSIHDNSFIPPVLFTRFKVFEQPYNLDTAINYKKEIVLSYKQNFFSFEFAALNYLLPEKNKFQYQMEGLNDNWIDAGSRSYASFTNLDPGKYIFRVKASNNDGVWNETGAAITLIITPPFWKTWWFIFICILGGSCFLYFLYRNRINQLLQLQSIRNKIASDLHDDVGSTLSSIAIFSDLAKSQTREVSPLLDQIGDSSRKMLDAMADIVWTINPDNDQFEKIILRMKSFAFELLGAKKIEFDFDTDEITGNLKLQMDVRKNLYLIFKEATNNLVKYAEADSAYFTIKEEKNNLIMLIRDNGKGFDIHKFTQGNGLKNMKRRAEEIGAQLMIKSEPGKGTTVQLQLSLS